MPMGEGCSIEATVSKIAATWSEVSHGCNSPCVSRSRSVFGYGNSVCVCVTVVAIRSKDRTILSLHLSMYGSSKTANKGTRGPWERKFA